MTRSGWLLLGMALLLPYPPGAGTPQAQASSAASPALFLGVVRGDGILIPIAVRENDRWRTLSRYDPESSSNALGTRRLVDTPRIPREGWIYIPAGGTPGPLAVRDLVTIRAYCEQQEGFQTDAPPPKPPLEAPHLKAGIAVHGAVDTAGVQDVTGRPDETSRRAGRFIVQLTEAMEAERAALPARPGRPNIPASGRGAVAVEITTLVRDQISGGEHYYFESRKRYAAAAAYASGWLSSSPFAISVVSARAGIDAGGDSAPPRRRVLGVLRLLGSSRWVMETRHYEGDSYDIVDMSPARQTLSIHGGGC